MTTTSPTRLDDSLAPSEAGSGRVRLTAAALAASSAIVVVLLATTPWGDRLDSGADEILNYESSSTSGTQHGRACSSTRSLSPSSG